MNCHLSSSLHKYFIEMLLIDLMVPVNHISTVANLALHSFFLSLIATTNKDFLKTQIILIVDLIIPLNLISTMLNLALD
jgi:hypothetical protein